MTDTGARWSIRTYEYERPDGVVLGEKYKFLPVEAPRGGEKKRKTLKDKARDKSTRGEYELNRLLTANFTVEDKTMMFSFSDDSINKSFPDIADESEERGDAESLDRRNADERLQRVGDLFREAIREVQRKNKKTLRVKVDYIFVVSDMDGETGEPERIHIHAIVRRELAELFAAAWKHGIVGTRSLFHDGEERDFFTYARYLIRQVRHIKGKRQFYAAKGLIQPKPTTLTNRRAGELTKPRGAEILNRDPYEKNEPQHMRYWYPNGKPGARLREPRRRE